MSRQLLMKDFEIDVEDEEDEDDEFLGEDRLQDGLGLTRNDDAPFDFAAAQRRRQQLQAELFTDYDDNDNDNDNDDDIVPAAASPRPQSEPYDTFPLSTALNRDNDNEDDHMQTLDRGKSVGRGIDQALDNFEYFAHKYGVGSATTSRPRSSGSRGSARRPQPADEVERDEAEIDDEREGDEGNDSVLLTGVDIETLMQTKREELQQLHSVSHVVDENKSLSDRFRAELEGYLDTLGGKVDAEGRPLVSLPRNFEAVVNAMTRDDLHDQTSSTNDYDDANGDYDNNLNSEKNSRSDNNNDTDNNNASGFEDRHRAHRHQPWYEYLLSDAADNAMDNEYAGRYHSLLDTATKSQESKLKKGLAEILLLDRQLFQLTKQVTALDDETGFQSKHSKAQHKNKRNNRSKLDYDETTGLSARSSGSREKGNTIKNNGFEVEDHDGNGDDAVSVTSESASRTGSRAGSVRDKTFLTTRHQQQPHSNYNSSNNTPRSARLAPKQRPRDRSALDSGPALPASHLAVSQPAAVLDEEDEEVEQAGREKSRITPYNLTAMQKLRMRELVELDDADFERDVDYVAADVVERDHALTVALAAFGHADRLQADLPISRESVELDRKLDFLTLQVIASLSCLSLPLISSHSLLSVCLSVCCTLTMAMVLTMVVGREKNER
jgi:hypothetical protein